MTTDRDAGGPLVAFAYDFDGTLAPGNMQDHAFIPGELGMERKAFWDEVGELAREQRGDNILAYMNLMLAKAAAKDVPLSHDAWRRRGADLPLFPGVTGWFERQNARARALGLELCHFIISSGNRELIEGSPIGHHFRRIYANGVSLTGSWEILAQRLRRGSRLALWREILPVVKQQHAFALIGR